MILYEKGTTDFSKNGLGYLNNVISASVIEELNGEYSLIFQYPINETLSNELLEERIVKCKVADGTQQCFIIKNVSKTYEKMTVTCSHLFYLLLTDLAENVYPYELTPKPFLDWILARANYQLPFNTTSDVSIAKSARYVRKNLVEVIMGNINNSMTNLFGIEIKRNNWNIGLNARLGADRGEKLIYGKNITGIDVTINTNEMYTRIMPIGFNGLILPEKYIDADNINDYPYPKIGVFEFSNIKYDPNDPEAYHTESEAYQALRDAVEELYNNKVNEPKINIKIDWLELSQTEEYKQYSTLERVELGDTIHAEIFGLNYVTRVIKTVYNPLTNRIEQFEIGTFQPSYATQMNKYEIDLQKINPESILEQAQTTATNLITNAMGGYVYKTNNELYIMDNEDPNQAVKVWRWNINGLGYSNTGINGTYSVAMTMNGSIVADFITTGQLNANVISASTIIGVINDDTSQLKLNADKIDLQGYVTATDLSTSGSTIINGNNITTGVIKSSNYVADTSGTKIDLSNGNAEINNGKLQIQTGMQDTSPSDYKIKLYNTSTLYNSKFYADGLIISNNDNINEPRTIIGASSITSCKGDLLNNQGFGTYLSPYYIRAIDSTSNIPTAKQSRISFDYINTPELRIDGTNIFNVMTKTLWQNSSMTSFASQTVTLDESINNYNYYEIISKINDQQDIYVSSGRCPVGLNISTVSQDGFKFVYRYITSMQGTSMTFGDCRVVNSYGSGTTVKNNSLIPYRIIGYK